MEAAPTGNNSAIERVKKFFSDRVKRVQSSDSKVHETLTTKAFGSGQITDTRAPHFVIDHTTMPISFEEDVLFSFPMHSGKCRSAGVLTRNGTSELFTPYVIQ